MQGDDSDELVNAGDDAGDVDYEFDDDEINVAARVGGDDAGAPVNDAGDGDGDGDEDIEPSVDTDTLREGLDDEAEEVTNADGDVVARERGLEAFTGHSEGRFECVVCGACTDTEHGAKVHYGSKHPDGGDADAVITPDEDGDDGVDEAIDWDDIGIESSDDDADAGGERSSAWDDVYDAYRNARVQSSPVTRSDARDLAVEALEDETEWMSIRERSETGKTYDLWRWDEDAGWQDDAKGYIGEVLVEELGGIAKDTEVNHIESLIARLNAVDQDATNAKHLDEMLIPVANGVIDVDGIEYDTDSMTIDWDSVELLDKDPDHRFLYQIDTEWDPDAADVDGLDEWLETITRTDEARRLIWEFAGHAAHPRYPADGFLTELGPGGSGKSQVLEVVKAMLGGENVAVQKLQRIQTGRFTGKTVVDKRANINTELSGKKIPSIDKLKVYAAGEEDMVEGKGTPFYKASNDATMMFASDDPPALPQDNRALGRRLYPVEFPCTYEDDPDPDNPFELQSRPKPVVQEELQADPRLKAALMRAVEGLVRLLEEGDFTSEKSWEERVEQYESFADPIKEGIRSCIIPADDGVIESGDLERTMSAFFADRGYDGRRMQQIVNVLEETAKYPVTKSRVRSFADDQDRHSVYKGIAFTAEAKEHWVPSSAYWSQYGGNPDADDADEGDGDEFDGVTLKEIRAEGPGRYDATKVTVNSVEDEPAPWLHDQGVVVGEDESLRYEVQSGIALDEGETYVLRDVIVAEDESDVKLQLVNGMTDVFHIEDRDGEQDAAVEDEERGDSPGYVDDEFVGDDEKIVDVEDDEEVSQEDRVDELKNVIAARMHRDDASGAKVSRVIEEAKHRGIDAGVANAEIERLKEQGVVTEPADGRVRVTGGE